MIPENMKSSADLDFSGAFWMMKFEEDPYKTPERSKAKFNTIIKI